MTDLLTLSDGKIIDLKLLPKDLQKRINKDAVLDILKRSGNKKNINAKRIDINKYFNQSLNSKDSEKTSVSYKKAINRLLYFYLRK